MYMHIIDYSFYLKSCYSGLHLGNDKCYDTQPPRLGISIMCNGKIVIKFELLYLMKYNDQTKFNYKLIKHIDILN